MLRKYHLLIAKTLIFTSFILLICSVIVYNEENYRLVDPSKATEVKKQDHDISITPSEDPDEDDDKDKDKDTDPNENPTSEEPQPTGNEKKPTTSTKPTSSSKPSSSPTQKPSTKPSSSSKPTTSPKPTSSTKPSPTPSTSPSISPSPTSTTPPEPSIDEINNNLRLQLQETYGFTLYYGIETLGYSVGGLSTYPVFDPYTIQSALNSLADTISKYPSGFFQEMKNGGIPLTLRLIQRYSNGGVTGVTNVSNSRAEISISLDYSFAESFNHEVFHYIEKFITKNGGGFNNWNTLNPQDFIYGNINNSLSYNKTYSEDASFVNNYAQTSESEDRASTFEYMMAATKASCLNSGKTINLKARNMADQVDLIYNTVSPYTTEYWERFLY